MTKNRTLVLRYLRSGLSKRSFWQTAFFVPCRKQVVLTKIGANSDSALYPQKQEMLLFRPRKLMKMTKMLRVVFSTIWLSIKTCVFDRVKLIKSIELIEADWNWLKMPEKSMEIDWKLTRIWGKTIEIAENCLWRFRMEGGAKEHLKMAGVTQAKWPFAKSIVLTTRIRGTEDPWLISTDFLKSRFLGPFVKVAHLQSEFCTIDFFRATNSLTKNAPKFSPKFLSLCSVGQKKSPENSLQISH